MGTVAAVLLVAVCVHAVGVGVSHRHDLDRRQRRAASGRATQAAAGAAADLDVEDTGVGGAEAILHRVLDRILALPAGDGCVLYGSVRTDRHGAPGVALAGDRRHLQRAAALVVPGDRTRVM